jgi:uncharacterized protein (DUF2141 family)
MRRGTEYQRRRRPQVWVFLALAACTVALTAQAQQPARDGARAAGTARLSGVVVTYDPVASPVRGATVTLAEVAGGLSKQTTDTDENGAFTFAELPAGRYDVSAIKAAYLKTSYGATRPERTGTPIALTDGQQVTTITLKMWRGGVITGLLLDPKGRPLPSAAVSVRRFQFVNGARTIATTTSGSATTDDRGTYRIFGLPPGEYAVFNTIAGAGRLGATPAAHQVTDEEIQRALRGGGAGNSAATAMPSSVPPPAAAFGYAPVYFPGTTVALDAVPVHLDAGEERSGVDFAVQLVPVANVSGTIAAPDKQTIANLQLSAVLTARSEPSGVVLIRSAATTADGQFTFGGVTPGQYTLTARGTPRRIDANDQTSAIGWWASTSVSVDGRDVFGTSLTLEPGVTVTGHVVFDGASPPAAAAAGVSVRLTPAHSDQGAADVRSAVATAEHTFTLAGVVPGEYLLSASLIARAGTVVGWTFRSASVGGHDVTDVPIMIAAGTAVDNAAVSFTDRPTEISGVFEDAGGRPAPEYFIVAFPVNRALWTAGSRRIQQVRPATDGKFTIRGLPAGDYALAATTDVRPDDLLDPAFFGQLLTARPIRISLKDGAKVTQNIRVARILFSMRHEYRQPQEECADHNDERPGLSGLFTPLGTGPCGNAH